MANGFPEGNFRIINKATGACISSLYGGQSHGLQDAATARGETGVLSYSHTNDREFTVHDKVKNIEEELWYFDSSADTYGRRKNMLYNYVQDIRSRWVLGANIEAKPIAYKLRDQDLEKFLGLLPEQNKETLAHLRTSDCLDITHLICAFIYVNCEETVKSELIGKLDDKKFDDYLNTVLAYDSLHNIQQKFQEYASSSFLDLNIPELKDLPENPFTQYHEQLYKIIIASIKLDILNRQNYSSDSVEFRLALRHQNLNTLLGKLKKEKFEELQDKVWKEYENIENPQKEAVKIIQELRETLNLNTNGKNIDTAKKILQTGLKSNESFEQLKTALNHTHGKELQAINMYGGNIFLQGSGRQYQTKWAFEDGYIFVEGQPDAVLTCLGDTHVYISHRSDNPHQRWEFKRA
ncbi:hypothetical protein I5515_10750 [Acinetobacter calcoaceticus]|uniref:hypothetical protein n=1 Tax=Acinetobacter calcoaceticus TaxID=471 RepID=UPI00190206E1|nr:hypothetical protein [Acinetobacter calcoaceticus]MBJ9722278.1 hypothetical protein [Acinetobacter calcoaceticus]